MPPFREYYSRRCNIIVCILIFVPNEWKIGVSTDMSLNPTCHNAEHKVLALVLVGVGLEEHLL